jgi:transcriptional regulator with XRE-family HTH domain
MDASHILRAARRDAGLSQRAMALQAGVALRTLSGAESGRSGISAALLDQLLESVGLDVGLVPRLDAEASAELRRHLRLSLTQRLRLALGEPPSVHVPPRTRAWQHLLGLSREGRVVLEGQLATAIWLPIGVVEQITTSTVGDNDHPSLVPITLVHSSRVWVRPPGELAMPDEQSALLRQADLLLHAHAALDDADRRRPPHRDPDEDDEHWRLLVSKGADQVVRPDARLSRAWRLNAPASLQQQLRASGTLPT